MSTLSAVIVTAGRVESLSRCLHALEKQTRHPDEVIIIANGAQATAIRGVIREFSSRFSVIDVTVDEQSIPKARNLGIQKSTGGLIAFVDDDCEPFEDWCEAILQAAEEYEELIFQGMAEEEMNRKLFSIYAGAARRVYIHTYSTCKDSGGQFRRELDTVNVAFRSEIFENPENWFDERLARCSDAHLGARLFRKGYRIRYCPSIRVRHSSGHDLTSFFTKAFLTGESRFLMKSNKCETGGRTNILLSLVFTLRLAKGQRPVIGSSIMLMNFLFNAIGAVGFLRRWLFSRLRSAPKF